MATKCTECSSAKIYKYKEPISAHGGYGPNFIPKAAGGFFTASPCVETSVCLDCGLVRLYATEITRGQIGDSKHWQRA